MLSIVIPAYNEEKMILKTTEVVSGIMETEKIPFLREWDIKNII